MSKIGIVFFGSGPVSLESLQQLKDFFDFEAIITKPSTEVDMQSLNLAPVYSVQNKQELSQLIAKQQFSSRLAILIDFGIIVNQDVIDAFPLGIINSHFSLLPEWRGADPITFAILSGQPKTGVSLMVVDADMDTGKLLRTKSLPIDPTETTPSLTAKLIELSSKLLIENIPLYLSGKLKPKSQPHPDRATYSRKISKEDGRIDWNKPAEQIEREIRAFYNWPRSFTKLFDLDVSVVKATVSDGWGTEPGTIAVNFAEGLLKVQCKYSSLIIEELLPSGRKLMNAKEFLNGQRNRILQTPQVEILS